MEYYIFNAAFYSHLDDSHHEIHPFLAHCVVRSGSLPLHLVLEASSIEVFDPRTSEQTENPTKRVGSILRSLMHQTDILSRLTSLKWIDKGN